jgi:hypothetical protein
MRTCPAKKFLPVIAVFGVACGGGADPFSDDPVAPLPGVLCANGSFAAWGDMSSFQPPTISVSWAAIQRENQPWQTIDATEATVTLNPGEKIGMARWLPALSPHSGNSLQIFFVTAEQAQTAFPCVPSSTKSVHGTAQGLEDPSLPGNRGGVLSIGNSSTSLADGPFTLDGLALGHTDLVATRLDAPPRTIIRRGVDYPNGSAIPLFNFGSIEAIGLEPHTLTVNGTNIIQFDARSQIVTQRGTVGLLSDDFAREGSGIRTLTLYSVPESRLNNDEVQFFSVDPEDYRKAMVFFRHPADRTLTLGPDPTTATATHLGTAPNLTLRLDMPSQPEYGAQVAFGLCSPGASSSSPGTGVGILVTKEYFGATPPTWSVTAPDLKSVQGFPGADIRAYNLCSVGGLSNVPFVFAPQTTHDGDVFTSLAFGAKVLNQ